MTDFRDEDIIRGCKKNKKKAQFELYKKYAPVLRAVAYRYLNDRDIADDLVHDAIINIFEKINQYKGSGSFEGWMKRIMINTILMYFRKQKFILPIDDSYMMKNKEDESDGDFFVKITNKVSQQEILELINNLPAGYRMVFNLYVFENYTHKQIAKMLNISESTSKTQLMRARKMLKQQLMELLKRKNFEF